MVKAVDIHIVNPKVCRTQIFVVPRHLHTAYMRSVASLRDAAKPLVKHLVRNGVHRACAGIQMQHRNLSIMISRTEQELVLIVCGEIAASHAVCGRGIHKVEISVRQNLIAGNACIRDRIEILTVVRDCDIRGIGDVYLAFLLEPSILHINIIDFNAVLIAHRIG